jgi:hypothetical protein
MPFSDAPGCQDDAQSGMVARFKPDNINAFGGLECQPWGLWSGHFLGLSSAPGFARVSDLAGELVRLLVDGLV